jgi:hypothetical protein
VSQNPGIPEGTVVGVMQAGGARNYQRTCCPEARGHGLWSRPEERYDG